MVPAGRNETLRGRDKVDFGHFQEAMSLQVKSLEIHVYPGKSLVPFAPKLMSRELTFFLMLGVCSFSKTDLVAG